MKRIGMRGIVAIVALIVLCGGIHGKAHAWVKFCNGQRGQLDAAVAYGPKDAPGTSTGGDLGVTVEGWWTLKPNECKEVATVDASGNWLYAYWERRNGSTNGTSLLCVQDHKFTWNERFGKAGDHCKPGNRLVGFSRFDADKKNWTLTLE